MSLRLFIVAFFGWLGGGFGSHIIQGTWFNSTEANIVNTLSVIKIDTLFGLFPLPVVNIDFFRVGIPAIFSHNYSFLASDSMWMVKTCLFGSLNFISLICFLSIIIGVVTSFYHR